MNFKHIVLFQTCKDTKFVSNSQQNYVALATFKNCFRRAKIQNLSAIHNKNYYMNKPEEIVSDVQRYKICQQFTTDAFGKYAPMILFQTCKDTKFVSNSQLKFSIYIFYYIVSDVQRYKICQQFTTNALKYQIFNLLFQTCKDTKFVSNSQRCCSE